MPTPAPSQTVHGGVIGGPTIATFQSKLDGGTPLFSEDRVGAAAGLTLRVDFTKLLALQFDLLYTQKGFSTSRDFNMRVDYIELPLLVRANVPVGSNLIAPILLGGVAPGKEISCGGRTTPPSVGLDPSDPIPLDCFHMRTRLWDLSVVGGAGISLELGRWSTTLEYRYTRGLHNMSHDFRYVRSNNRAASFLAGVTVPVWRE